MKNKIYSYFLSEFLSLFIIILLTVTFITWVVQAVNYLEFVTEDGHSFNVYFFYSLLSMPKVAFKLLPFVYLITLFAILLQFEKNNELLIYWTNGINKIDFVNQIIKISIFFTLVQILCTSFLVPYAQNKARSFLRTSHVDLLPSLIKEKKFIDTVENLTIFIDKKNDNGEMTNIFLKDSTRSRTIIAKKGIIKKKGKTNFLILTDGTIHTESEGTINFLDFKKTEINLSVFKTKSTTFPKLQERSTMALLDCFVLFKNKFNMFLNKEDKVVFCERSKDEIRQEINKRLSMPIYLPLLTLLLSLMLNYSKDYKLKVYLIFCLAFVFLIISEITIRVSGNSNLTSLLYLLFPITLSFLVYLFLLKKYKILRIGI